ncbi:MAG: DNA helicase RecG, partial [Patescibacteria group bacterium]
TEGEATKRLLALEKINDGFRLAEIDLELRGPGQVYGKEQSGKIAFRLADTRDINLIKKSQEAAQELLALDPELKKYPRLKEYLKKNIKKIHLE